jgi:hypothetical protein
LREEGRKGYIREQEAAGVIVTLRNCYDVVDEVVLNAKSVSELSVEDYE